MIRFATDGWRFVGVAVFVSSTLLFVASVAFAMPTGGADSASDEVAAQSTVAGDGEKQTKAEKKKAERAAKQQRKEAEREAKQRRRRGRTVRAVVVPSTPTAPAVATAPAASEPAPTSSGKRTRTAAAEATAPETERAPAATDSRPAERAAPEPATEPRSITRAPVARLERPRNAARTTAPADVPADLGVSESIRVAEVLLDVLVTDRKGNVVEGLEAGDFVVLHDGEEQEVVSASFYGGPNELAGSGTAGSTRADRYFILLFHDQRFQLPALTGPQMDNARWLRRWVEQELQPNDQVAVFAYQARLKFYLDFSRDRDAILAAVDAAASGKKDLDRWLTRSAPEFDPNSPSLGVNLPNGKEMARRSRKLQQALELLGEAAEGIAGRKNLVMFSLGFGEIGQFGRYTPDARYYPPMREALNAGNVAVYSIDTMGNRRGVLNDSLSLLSSETGGHYYSNFTNVMTPMRQVSEENQGYYLVSFRSEYEAGTEGYRGIKVRIRDREEDSDERVRRRKYKVRSRTGFRFGEASGP